MPVGESGSDQHGLALVTSEVSIKTLTTSPGSHALRGNRFPTLCVASVATPQTTQSVEVRVPTILRSYTGGQKVVTGSGDTIAELLTNLDTQYAGLRARLVTEEGGLHKFVNVYINDEDVRFLGALDAKLNDGDTVTILPAVAGG